MIRDIVVIALIVAGCLFFIAGTVGIIRFGDLNTRLHALAKADNLGFGLVLAGAALHAGSLAVAGKLVLIWVVALVSSATAGHLLATSPAASSPAVSDADAAPPTDPDPDVPPADRAVR